jgi:hypothetical protein
MRKTLFLLALTSVTSLSAYNDNKQADTSVPSLQTVDEEISTIQAQYEEAVKLFNPWYAGPLLTPSARCVPPGMFNLQPYWFYSRIDSQYNAQGTKQRTASTTQNQVNVVFQTGLINRVDIEMLFGAQATRTRGVSATSFQDISLFLGGQILEEDHYRPAVKGLIGTFLPTGRYRNLNPAKFGTQASGAGAYYLNMGLVASKVVWWLTTNPFQVRFSFQYFIPSNVHVKGFHAYGGGFGTDGHEHVGNKIKAYTSFEYSLTKRWVFAMDTVYDYENKSTFEGNPGIAQDGSVAINDVPSAYTLSLAPAIEYNATANLGFLLGGEVVVYARNKPNLTSAIFTFTYTW